MAYRWHAWQDGLTADQINTVFDVAHEMCRGSDRNDYLDTIQEARRSPGWIRMPLVGLLKDWQRELRLEGAADSRASVDLG